MQIQLTDEQHDRLRHFSRERGISLSEAIRRWVEDGLSRRSGEPPRDRLGREALAVVGKYDDEGSRRVGRDHDAHLAEAIDG